MKSGVLTSLIWLTIKFQIIKDLDIYSSYLIISLNICGLQFCKINVVKLTQMNFQIL